MHLKLVGLCRSYPPKKKKKKEKMAALVTTQSLSLSSRPPSTPTFGGNFIVENSILNNYFIFEYSVLKWTLHKYYSKRFYIIFSFVFWGPGGGVWGKFQHFRK